MSVMSIFKKKSFYIILILVLTVVGYSIYVKIENERYERAMGDNVPTPVGATEDLGRSDTYTLYLEQHKAAARPDVEIDIDLFDYSSADLVEQHDKYEGEENVLVTKEGGYIEWTVNVPKAGMYNFNVEYFPIKSRGIDIERALLINGEVPFAGANSISLSRVWTDRLWPDGSRVRIDSKGNQVRPSQVEAPRWQKSYFKDHMGFFTEPYAFYLKEGENVIRLEAVSEPMAIKRLVIGQRDELLAYDDFIASFDKNQYQNKDKNFVKIKQGEDAEFRSAPTLYALFDRASSNTDPYSAAKIKLNMIGGDAWRIAGQWIEWEIEVPEDGLYNISIKGRQNYNRGMVSNRKLYVNGVTPFKEAEVISFQYNTEWSLVTLANDEGVPYQFPLRAGKNTIRLEVTLGQLGGILNQIEDSVYRLNSMYRKILVLTGSKPDEFRDYRIDKVYPDVIEAMEKEAETLNNIVKQLTEYSGQKGSETAIADNLAKQLQRFVKNPDVIPRTLENFRQNISSLGTSILNLSNAQLDIDFLIVSADGADLPKVKETFFGKVAHEFRSFIASFFEDYSTIGGETDGIEVWLIAGRDQATILRNMIDETFTPNNGIGVNVKLVAMEALLPAVVAGIGPDVALTVSLEEPVNYALRGAAVDLSKFPGFEELSKEYHESAFVPFEFDGGIYAIPETQNFNVMFYRKDLLGDIGVEIPNTWQDVIEILPILQKNNMQFAIPSTERLIGTQIVPDTSAMYALLFQNGGQVYTDDHKRTLLDEENSVEAFEFYTMLYTHYGVPQRFDFVNRFRTGEMPIGIADYNNFNTLTVFAPELRGLWDFALVPGTPQEDGTIDRSVSFWGQASMMLSSSKNQDKAWEFLKWWGSAETKVRFGRELESIIGAAARYPTANIVSFEEMAWSSQNAAVIKEQWNWVVGNPNVAGGYYTNRHLINAFRKVTYNKEDARETLLDYTRKINDELKYKRKELGLPYE